MGTCNILKGFTLISVIAIVATVIYCANQVDAKPSAMAHLSGSNSPWNITKFEKKLNPIAVLDNRSNQVIFVTGSLSPHYPVIVQTPIAECSIDMNLRYNSIGDRAATSLGNGKVIASFRNVLMLRGSPTSAVNHVDWKIVIVDPVNLCSNINLTVDNEGSRLIQVLPYQDSFDVIIENTFFKIGDHHLVLDGPTQVIRANDKGELTRNFARIQDNKISKVVLARRYDPSQGYYYITRSGDKKSLIKKLDSKFQMVNSYEFEHAQYNRYDQNAFSAEHGQFSLCYYINDNKYDNLKCLILSADLNSKVVEVPLTFDHDIEHVTVDNYADGTVLVVYSRKSHPDTREYLLVAQLIDKNGKIGGPTDLGKTSDVITKISSFEMKDGSYCLAVSTDGQIMTKCFD